MFYLQSLPNISPFPHLRVSPSPCPRVPPSNYTDATGFDIISINIGCLVKNVASKEYYK